MPAISILADPLKSLRSQGSRMAHAIPANSLDALAKGLIKNMSDTTSASVLQRRQTVSCGIGLLKIKTTVTVIRPLVHPVTRAFKAAILALKAGGFDTRSMGLDAVCG
jgi:hypothetical protein